MSDAITGVAGELASCAARFVKDQRLAGAAVGVVTEGELAWSAGVGFADLAEARPSTPSTLYAIASITKTVTGTAVMRLVDEGRIGLDDPITAYLPELIDADVARWPIESATIRRLLSHESGLAEEPAGTDWPRFEREGVPSEVLRRVGEIGIRVAPNSQGKYSNLGFELLGEVVSRVAGVPYAEYVRSTILRPLGMDSTDFRPLPADLDARRATGYAPRAFTDELDPVDVGPLSWAEAGLWSSVEDLGRWLVFQMAAYDEASVASPVLAPATLRAMHKPRYLADDAWSRAWGIAWYGVRRDDVVWIQHSGGWYGFITVASFDPIAKVGVVVLLNGVGEATALAARLGGIARAALAARAPVIDVPTPTPASYRALLGVYFDDEYAALVRVEWRDGRLVVRHPSTPGESMALLATDDPDVFIVEPGFRPSGERVRFTRRGDGRVNAMYLAVGTFRRLDTLD